MCQPIHKTAMHIMKILSPRSWSRWIGGARRSAKRPGSCRASQRPTASPLAAISMTRIQACGHLQVPAAANSNAAVAAFTAIVEMMSFAIMSAPIVRAFNAEASPGSDSAASLSDEPLAELRRPFEARDHRDPQQIVARQPGIARDGSQLVAEPRLLGRIARFQIALVLDRVLLHIFERDQPALCVVAVELAVAGLAGPDPRQPFGEVDDVMDAAVHAHAAERIVDVGGVADQEGAAHPEKLRHPLMH